MLHLYFQVYERNHSRAILNIAIPEVIKYLLKGSFLCCHGSHKKLIRMVDNFSKEEIQQLGKYGVMIPFSILLMSTFLPEIYLCEMYQSTEHN